MDMSKYLGSRFIKLADVQPRPIEGEIAGIVEGKYGPNLVLKSGDTLSLNQTNIRTLVRAYGTDSERWLGKLVRLLAGEFPYEGDTKPGVAVEPITPPTEPAKPADQKQPQKKSSTDFNDEIPF